MKFYIFKTGTNPYTEEYSNRYFCECDFSTSLKDIVAYRLQWAQDRSKITCWSIQLFQQEEEESFICINTHKWANLKAPPRILNPPTDVVVAPLDLISTVSTTENETTNVPQNIPKPAEETIGGLPPFFTNQTFSFTNDNPF